MCFRNGCVEQMFNQNATIKEREEEEEEADSRSEEYSESPTDMITIEPGTLL